LPRKRGIQIRIGPPLEISELHRLTEGQRKTQAARRVANLAREAVDRLRKGEVLDLSAYEDSPVVEASVESSPAELAERVFTDLGKRYDSTRIERPLSWYFALGPKGGPRWTVMVDKQQCTIQQGRPPTGKADCVVKTSADIFTRIVKEAYVPEPQQFISGAIKTNDIPLLIEFSRVFNLTEGLG
jgi:long-chain acyl-CoA synthetase